MPRARTTAERKSPKTANAFSGHGARQKHANQHLARQCNVPANLLPSGLYRRPRNCTGSAPSGGARGLSPPVGNCSRGCSPCPEGCGMRLWKLRPDCSRLRPCRQVRDVMCWGFSKVLHLIAPEAKIFPNPRPKSTSGAFRAPPSLPYLREGRGKAAPERKRRNALKSKGGWGMGEIGLGAAKHGRVGHY